MFFISQLIREIYTERENIFKSETMKNLPVSRIYPECSPKKETDVANGLEKGFF